MDHTAPHTPHGTTSGTKTRAWSTVENHLARALTAAAGPRPGSGSSGRRIDVVYLSEGDRDRLERGLDHHSS